MNFIFIHSFYYVLNNWGYLLSPKLDLLTLSLCCHLPLLSLAHSTSVTWFFFSTDSPSPLCPPGLWLLWCPTLLDGHPSAVYKAPFHLIPIYIRSHLHNILTALWNQAPFLDLVYSLYQHHTCFDILLIYFGSDLSRLQFSVIPWYINMSFLQNNGYKSPLKQGFCLRGDGHSDGFCRTRTPGSLCITLLHLLSRHRVFSLGSCPLSGPGFFSPFLAVLGRAWWRRKEGKRWKEEEKGGREKREEEKGKEEVEGRIEGCKEELEGQRREEWRGPDCSIFLRTQYYVKDMTFTKMCTGMSNFFWLQTRDRNQICQIFILFQSPVKCLTANRSHMDTKWLNLIQFDSISCIRYRQ